jgi:hypothetical protein
MHACAQSSAQYSNKLLYAHPVILLMAHAEVSGGQQTPAHNSRAAAAAFQHCATLLAPALAWNTQIQQKIAYQLLKRIVVCMLRHSPLLCIVYGLPSAVFSDRSRQLLAVLGWTVHRAIDVTKSYKVRIRGVWGDEAVVSARAGTLPHA